MCQRDTNKEEGYDEARALHIRLQDIWQLHSSKALKIYKICMQQTMAPHFAYPRKRPTNFAIDTFLKICQKHYFIRTAAAHQREMLKYATRKKFHCKYPEKLPNENQAKIFFVGFSLLFQERRKRTIFDGFENFLPSRKIHLHKNH